MKQLLYALICFLVLSTNVQAQQNISTPKKNRLTGCWNDSQTKEWKYGFFEKFAVYDNEYWDYQSIDFQKNKATIVLKKGNEVLNLKLTFDKTLDSVCDIHSSKGGKSKLIRYSEAPDFTKTDHISKFADTGYKQDSVTIIGYIRNRQKGMPFKISIPSFFSQIENDYHADIDSLGRFRIRVPVVNTSEVFIDWQRNGMCIPTVLEPGEKFFLYYDYANQDTRFMGSNSRFKQEFINYKKDPSIKQWNKYLAYDTKMDHDAYLLEKQKLYNEQQKLFKDYLATHPNVSNKFKFYEEKHLLMDLARSLMQRRFSLQRNFDKEQFSKAYIEYADFIYKQIPTPYSLCRDTETFLRDYFGYHNDLRTNNVTMSIIEALKYLDRTKEHPLTEQQKSDLETFEKVVSIGFMRQSGKIDSVRAKEMTAPYETAAKRANNLLQDSTTRALIDKCAPIMPALMQIKRINEKILCFDSISVSPLLKELIITQAVCNLFYKEKKALAEQCIEYFQNLVSNENFRKIVMEQQKELIHIANQKFEYAESLKNADHLKDLKDTNELLKRIISPHKGKVIYIDIWGTWCSPCKEEMKHAPAIKNALKGKDVVFMYFANNSPKASWENVIKENHLTGSNIVHYNLPREQEEMLEKLFSVRFFPTFVLIDKEGNIVDKNAPAPSHKEKLINKINKLLTK